MTTAVDALEREVAASDAEARAGAAAALSFEEIYEAHFDFVWRGVRRLGVPHESLADAAQDVFLVVHKRRADFAGRSSFKTWLFGIVVHVARAYRRKRAAAPALDHDLEAVPDAGRPSPEGRAEAAQALRALHAILDELGDERREVFVLLEMEEMSAPEAAIALGLNVNTVYSRLRAARQEFESAVARRAARDGWRFK